jgi:hypothetical protein
MTSRSADAASGTARELGLLNYLKIDARCPWASWWQLTQRTTRFSAVSSPKWLRG